MEAISKTNPVVGHAALRHGVAIYEIKPSGVTVCQRERTRGGGACRQHAGGELRHVAGRPAHDGRVGVRGPEERRQLRVAGIRQLRTQCHTSALGFGWCVAD